MDTTTTLQAVQAWPPGEQLDFLFRAWDQFIDGGPPPELTEEMRGELRRRLARHDADPTRVLTWEQVEEYVRRPR